MIDFRKIVGYYSPSYPALDKTTPWFEFNSYIFTCESLGVTPRLSRFVSYNRYYKSVIEKEES